LILLKSIKSYFKDTGKMYSDHVRSKIHLQVTSVKDLKIIIEHFDKYPLKTKKFADYILFRKVFNLILDKQHLTTEGINKIVAIKASTNLGLSSELKVAFPDVIPVLRHQGEKKIIPDLHSG